VDATVLLAAREKGCRGMQGRWIGAWVDDRSFPSVFSRSSFQHLMPDALSTKVTVYGTKNLTLNTSNLNIFALCLSSFECCRPARGARPSQAGTYSFRNSIIQSGAAGSLGTYSLMTSLLHTGTRVCTLTSLFLT
jgi:hypothetical protein